jgi:uncharacterized membrane protein
MGTKGFSITEAIRFGWDILKGNTGFFIGLLIVAFLIQTLPRIIGDFVIKDFPLISIILYLASSVLNIVVQLGLLKISLKFCDGIKGEFDDLLSTFNLLISYSAASILYGLIVLGGLILFIVPGIIWGIKFSLYPYFIVDKGIGPVEAIKASGRATEGEKLNLFVFGIVLGLINFAGALFILIGLFITIPISMVAYAHVYRALAGNGSVIYASADSSPGQKNVMYINLGA